MYMMLMEFWIFGFFRFKMEFKLELLSLLCVLAFATQMMDRVSANPSSGDRTQVDNRGRDPHVMTARRRVTGQAARSGNQDPSETKKEQSRIIIELKKKMQDLKKDQKKAKGDNENLKDELEKCRGGYHEDYKRSPA